MPGRGTCRRGLERLTPGMALTIDGDVTTAAINTRLFESLEEIKMNSVSF